MRVYFIYFKLCLNHLVNRMAFLLTLTPAAKSSLHKSVFGTRAVLESVSKRSSAFRVCLSECCPSCDVTRGLRSLFRFLSDRFREW